MQNAGNDAARVAADARARKQTPGAIRVNGIDVGAGGIYPELAHSVEQLSDLAAECERLRAENRELIYRAQSLTGEMERLQAENRALRDTCKMPPDSAISLQLEIERLRRENTQLHQALEGITRDRSEILARMPRIDAISLERSELWKSQRVAILVDVQNMYYSARKIYGSKLSFQKLLPTLLNNRRLVRAIAYVVEKEGADQEKFYEVLRRTGFEIKRRDLIVRSDGSRKGDWDMGIAIDAISMAEKVDVVVLVTGDGDFVALVNMLKSRGVRVEVASFRESTSENLMYAANEHYLLDQEMLV
ncbi:MAG TPA: NYN domain-containing protein [Planctomycetota bacterium]|nr:NYN domain-containing protein [Planctomycetota bacterium]